jgi:TolB protein
MKRFCAVVVVAGLALLSGVVALSGSNPAGAGQFPGSNGKIASVKRKNSCFCSNIWVMNPDGSGDTQLTFPGESNISNTFPSWSPDGTRIAFASDRDGNDEVYVMNADGSGQTNLTNNPDSDDQPSWSPDGTRIAFNSLRDGNAEVYVMDADGSGQTNITNNPEFDGSPSWSPDGTRIGFTSIRDGNAEVYVMDADGSGQTNITNNPASDGGPSWSPDGTRIAFTSFRDGNAEVYVMDAAGTGQTRLTTSVGYYPSWSPDGTRIAFISNRDAIQEVYVMDADGTGQARVTTTAGGGRLVLAWQSVPVAPLLAVAPTIQRNATAGNGRATVNWNAPSPNGSLAVTGYVVTPYSGYYALAPQTFTSTATTQTVTGLMNGTTYRFRVAARNAFGTGPMSQVSNPVTTPTAPGGPTIGAAVAGHGEATVSWTAPVSDGGSPITGYVVTPYSGYYALAPRTFTSTATTQTVTGLMNGTTYRFRVRAINAVGTGGYSKVTNSVTPTP